MNNHWAFLPMRVSNDLLGEPGALRQRLDEDGYLYLRRVLDPDKVMALRKQVLLTLADHGWVRRHPLLMKGFCTTTPVREIDEAYLTVYDDVQRLEAFHTLAHDDDLMAVVRQALGDSAFPHPLKIARLSFPSAYEISTPPHQDYPNNQGTPSLTAAWVPLGACPIELGGLAVLRGSNHYGVLPLDRHFGPGNRHAVLSEQMLEDLRWVTTDYEAGDVLLFGSTTVHASLHNASELFMRLSVDFRYQLEGESLTPGCLLPHFQRLTWAQIYADWSSDRYQYYWKDLDYQVVPFQELPLVRPDDEVDKDAMAAFQRRTEASYERRMRQLADLFGDEPNEPALQKTSGISPSG
jgi:hypothetical protein